MKSLKVGNQDRPRSNSSTLEKFCVRLETTKHGILTRLVDDWNKFPKEILAEIQNILQKRMDVIMAPKDESKMDAAKNKAMRSCAVS